MNNMTRTLVYVAAAVVMSALAIWKGMPTPELNSSQFSDTGKEYYPDFENPNEATGIRVVVFDEESSDIKPFEVQFKNGLWRIPSHYDYPADGEEQLAKTAASLVGVKRGAVAGESELDSKRLGVVDPLTDDVALKEFSGDRLTLTKGETVLVDLIIGNPVPDRNGFYYVRKPDEKLTYIAELEIDLSTNFSDWIEPDLLKIDQNKVRRINIRDYAVDEAKGSILISDYFDLNRADQAGPWSMEVFDPKTQKPIETISELKTAEVNNVLSALTSLKIAGVRPKPAFISSDLKLNGDVTPSRESSLFLSQMGFFFAPNEEKQIYELFSNQGDLTAVTEDGVAYTLRFGGVFTGDEFDVEVGSTKPDGEEEPAEEAEVAEGLTKNRYLFVSVQFDPTALGDIPVRPVPPSEKKPEEAAKKPEATEEKKVEENSDKAAESKTEKKIEIVPAKTEEKPDPQKVYEAALVKYNSDLESYKKKIEDGLILVEKLNQRFADWYYVIDATSFDKLNKGRVDLVEVEEPVPTQSTEPKETPEPTGKPAPKKAETPKETPEKPKAPVTKKPEPPKATEIKKPASKPVPEQPKPEEPPKTEEKPAS
ncbi:MAG: DUF4340 domain-containing protein [Planctomycetaceae bacterium]|nr:DUF4340 domain-containing protein [Planctomycetaceae bacterium]